MKCTEFLHNSSKYTDPAFTFNDVSLYSEETSSIESRASIKLENPNLFLTTNMQNITGHKMCNLTGIYRNWTSILPRFYSTEAELFEEVHQITKPEKVIYSLGIKDISFEVAKVSQLVEYYGATQFIIDVANGNSNNVFNILKELQQSFSTLNLKFYIGNFFGSPSSDYLRKALDHNVAGVRIGIGAGQKCLTRSETAMGFPMLSAIANTKKALLNIKDSQTISIIADGGIKTPADAIKCFAFGADSVCLGSAFDSTDATPGKYKRDFKGKYKVNYGMSSHYHIQNYWGFIRNGIASEGLVKKVYNQGTSADIIHRFNNGLKSALSYANATTLEEFKDKVHFTFITESSGAESYLR